MHKYLHFQSYDCHTSTNFKLCAPDEEKLYVFLTLDEQKSQTLTTFLFRVWAERTDGKSLYIIWAERMAISFCISYGQRDRTVSLSLPESKRSPYIVWP